MSCKTTSPNFGLQAGILYGEKTLVKRLKMNEEQRVSDFCDLMMEPEVMADGQEVGLGLSESACSTCRERTKIS